MKDPNVIIGLAVIPEKAAEIERIIANKSGRCTIIFFKDGGKEVVRCSKEDQFDVYVGAAIGIARHVYKTSSQFHKAVNKVLTIVEPKEKKPKKQAKEAKAKKEKKPE